MTMEGVISILEGMNPRMLETKLRGLLQPSKQKELERTKQAVLAQEAVNA
jgi:flagellar motor component MotA